jgi:hypothetical protein
MRTYTGFSKRNFMKNKLALTLLASGLLLNLMGCLQKSGSEGVSNQSPEVEQVWDNNSPNGNVPNTPGTSQILTQLNSIAVQNGLGIDCLQGTATAAGLNPDAIFTCLSGLTNTIIATATCQQQGTLNKLSIISNFIGTMLEITPQLCVPNIDWVTAIQEPIKAEFSSCNIDPTSAPFFLIMGEFCTPAFIPLLNGTGAGAGAGNLNPPGGAASKLSCDQAFDLVNPTAAVGASAAFAGILCVDAIKTTEPLLNLPAQYKLMGDQFCKTVTNTDDDVQSSNTLKMIFSAGGNLTNAPVFPNDVTTKCARHCSKALAEVLFPPMAQGDCTI